MALPGTADFVKFRLASCMSALISARLGMLGRWLGFATVNDSQRPDASQAHTEHYTRACRPMSRPTHRRKHMPRTASATPQACYTVLIYSSPRSHCVSTLDIGLEAFQRYVGRLSSLLLFGLSAWLQVHGLASAWQLSASSACP
jgi:hypothetical protein